MSSQCVLSHKHKRANTSVPSACLARCSLHQSLKYFKLFMNFCHTQLGINRLSHWGRVTHICASKLNNTVSDNGLAMGRRQTTIWNNAGILLIRNLGTNISDFFSEIHILSFKKMNLKMSYGKWRPFCLGLNALSEISTVTRRRITTPLPYHYPPHAMMTMLLLLMMMIMMVNNNNSMA